MELILRFGELILKSHKVRRRFIHELMNNCREALAHAGEDDPWFENHWSHFEVELAESSGMEALKRVFGISTLSVVESFEFNDMSGFVEQAAERLKQKMTGKKYAVRAKRVGRHPFGSMDVERELGSALNPYGKVDLTNPEITLYVRIKDQRASVFTERISGAGGLPLGTEDEIMVLFSGGFDSTIAAWNMLKRGCPVHYVFCSLGGELQEIEAIRIAKYLADNWSYGYSPQFHILDFRPVIDEMNEKITPEYKNIILKRLFYRAAQGIARYEDAGVFATGESIGQVSSQTLSNLISASAPIDMPIFRPLIGLDKTDIMNISMRIGVYELCSKVKEYCNVVPKHPKTRSRIEKVDELEDRMDPGILDQCIDGARVVDLKTYKQEQNRIWHDVESDDIPDNALFIDVREAEEFEKKHVAGALNMRGHELEVKMEKVSSETPVILYCEIGVVSRDMAVFLREEGFQNVYSMKNGIRQLKKLGLWD